MKRILPILMITMFATLLIQGCEHDTSNGPADPVDPGPDPVVTDKTCLGCHSDQAELVLALGQESGSKVPVPDKGDG